MSFSPHQVQIAPLPNMSIINPKMPSPSVAVPVAKVLGIRY